MFDDGLLKATLYHPAQSQRIVRRDARGVEPQRVSRGFLRLIARANVQLRDRQIGPPLQRRRIELQRMGELFAGLPRLIASHISSPQVHMGLKEIRRSEERRVGKEGRS